MRSFLEVIVRSIIVSVCLLRMDCRVDLEEDEAASSSSDEPSPSQLKAAPVHISSILFAGVLQTKEGTAFCTLCKRYADHKHVAADHHRRRVRWHKVKVISIALPYTQLKDDEDTVYVTACKCNFWPYDHLIFDSHIDSLEKGSTWIDDRVAEQIL